MQGTLYGVGIGPGDPELLTLKAVRIIKACDYIAVPGQKKEDTVAYQITVQAVPEIAQMNCLEIHMPMTKDKEALRASHDAAAGKIAEVLQQGKSVAFLTLGDPSVYSTYLYVHKRILQMGLEAELVSGIPSFCAVAAKMNMGLVETSQPLHVIPASYQIEEALQLPGTKVLMKAGKKMKDVKKRLMQMENAKAVMIENCGMPGEKRYYCAEEIPENAGYYSLIIVKEES